LFRVPQDLETLITLADSGFRVASAHGTRDLDDPDDRFILRIEVAHAARSSDDTQRRIKRRLEQLRRDGVAHFRARCFGFPGLDRGAESAGSFVELDLDALGGADEEILSALEGVGRIRWSGPREPVSAELVGRERVALKEGTRAALAGIEPGTIAKEWNADGLTTVTGKLWTAVAVRDVLLRPRNAGLIEHEGQMVGRMPGDPIVEEEDFLRLRAKFAGRKRGRPPGAAYLGTGIVRCEVCGRTVNGRPHVGVYPDGQKRRQYTCMKARGGCGKVAADARAIERELRGFVISRLSDPDHAAALAAVLARCADRLAEVEAEIRECEALQAALSERLGRRQISLDSFDIANEPLSAALDRLTAERESLAGGTSGQRETPEALSEAEVSAEWDASGVAERRGMLTAALGRERVFIAPAAGRGKFDPSRIKIPCHRRPHQPAD
jgi:hypothetical protein